MIKNIAPMDVNKTIKSEDIQLGETYVKDGKVYRFAKFASAVEKGHVVAHPADDTNLAGLTVVGDVAVGGKKVTFGALAADIASGELVGKELFIISGDGAGYSYEILANEAGTTGNNVTVTVAGIESALVDATSKVAVLEARYNGVTVMPVDNSAEIAGVATFDITADDIANGDVYAFIQVSGYALLKGSGNVNEEAEASTAVAGEVSDQTTPGVRGIGVVTSNPGGDYVKVELTIS